MITQQMVDIAHAEYHTVLGTSGRSNPMHAALEAHEKAAWHNPAEVPAVPAGQLDNFIVAVRRGHNGKIYSFPAVYLNAYPLRYEDGCPETGKWECCEKCYDGCPTTGWYQGESDGDDSTNYGKVLNAGDELISWRTVPQWERLFPDPARSCHETAED